MSLEHDVLARVRAAAEIAIDEKADQIHGQAVQLAPIETGRLRESARVDTTRNDEHYYEDTVSFNTPYAARQHEELTWEHPRGGQAKYLEAPLKSNMPTIEEHIAKRVKEAVEGG